MTRTFEHQNLLGAQYRDIVLDRILLRVVKAWCIYRRGPGDGRLPELQDQFLEGCGVKGKWSTPARMSFCGVWHGREGCASEVVSVLLHISGIPFVLLSEV